MGESLASERFHKGGVRVFVFSRRCAVRKVVRGDYRGRYARTKRGAQAYPSCQGTWYDAQGWYRPEL